MKQLLLLLSILVLPLCSKAQTLTGQAPARVTVDETFRVSYTIDTQDAENFCIGQIPADIEVIYGPSKSMSTSTQISNGQTTTSQSTTYTYVLKARRAGSIVLPAAHVTVDGQDIASNTLYITIDPADSNQPTGNGQSAGSSQTSTKTAARGDELFITAMTDKATITIGDSLSLTIKLYTNCTVSSFEAKKRLQIDGCYYKELSAPQIRLTQEHYRGKTYNTCTIATYTLVPLRKGAITIPGVSYDFNVTTPANVNADSFDAFFSGNSRISEMRRTAEAPSLKITVK